MADGPAGAMADTTVIPGLPIMAHRLSHGQTAPAAAHYKRHNPAPAPAPVHDTSSQQAFIGEVAPGAIAAQRKYGVPASVTIAQAIDESGWGQSTLATKDHNLFGIKGTGPAGSDPLPPRSTRTASWCRAPARSASTTTPRKASTITASSSPPAATTASPWPTGGTRTRSRRRSPGSTPPTRVTAPSSISLMRQYNLYRYDVASPAAKAGAHVPGGGPSPVAATSPGAAATSPVGAASPVAAIIPGLPVPAPTAPASLPSPAPTPSGGPAKGNGPGSQSPAPGPVASGPAQAAPGPSAAPTGTVPSAGPSTAPPAGASAGPTPSAAPSGQVPTGRPSSVPTARTPSARPTAAAPAAPTRPAAPPPRRRPGQLQLRRHPRRRHPGQRRPGRCRQGRCRQGRCRPEHHHAPRRGRQARPRRLQAGAVGEAGTGRACGRGPISGTIRIGAVGAALLRAVAGGARTAGRRSYADRGEAPGRRPPRRPRRLRRCRWRPRRPR